MTDAMEIPAFLRRTANKPGDAPMTVQTSAPAIPPKTKQKRKDAYVARLTISIPLDMSNADSLSAAIKAVAGIEATLPAGTIFKSEGSLGKI